MSVPLTFRILGVALAALDLFLLGYYGFARGFSPGETTLLSGVTGLLIAFSMLSTATIVELRKRVDALEKRK